jgi:peptidylprolyl isomerase
VISSPLLRGDSVTMMRFHSPRTVRSLTAVILLSVIVATTAACTTSSGDDLSGAGADPTTVTDISLVPTTPTVPEPVEVPEVDIPAEIPTELQITNLIEGSGPAAAEGDLVVVDYVGVRSATGEMFDNSYQRGQPLDLVLGRGMVITGWELGLVGVQVGTRRQLDIPADLAYGDNPPGGSVIQAGDALTFLVDVRAVVGASDPESAPVDLASRAVLGGADITIDDVVVGDGGEITEGRTALVNVLLVRGNDYEVIYNNWEFGYPDPIVVNPNQTLGALVEGLLGMRVGGTRVVVVPAALGFGEQGNEQIGLPPGVDLIMILELVGSF